MATKRSARRVTTKIASRKKKWDDVRYTDASILEFWKKVGGWR